MTEYPGGGKVGHRVLTEEGIDGGNGSLFLIVYKLAEHLSALRSSLHYNSSLKQMVPNYRCKLPGTTLTWQRLILKSVKLLQVEWLFLIIQTF